MFDTDSEGGCGSGADTGAGLINAITTAARTESAAIATRLAAIGELDLRREAELADTIFWTTDPFEAVAAEISAALNITRHRAGTQIRYARVLRDRLPHVAELLAAGVIDFRVVTAIIVRTQNVRPETCHELDDMLARHAAKWMRLSKNALRDRIDFWVIKLDPDGQRVPPNIDESRHITIEPTDIPAIAGIWATVHAEDAAAFNQQLDALARTVCPHDPRTHQQRRADALGPLARGQAQLPCRCGLDDCPAAQHRATANAAMIHILADHSTLTGHSDNPGYLPGYGVLPADTIRTLATHAKHTPVVIPTNTTDDTTGDAADTGDTPGDTTDDPADTGAADTNDTADTAHAGQTISPTHTGDTPADDAPSGADAHDTGTKDAAHTADAHDTAPNPGDIPGDAEAHAAEAHDTAEAADTAMGDAASNPTPDTPGAEPGYRPSAALREFIYWRDLTCRFPGCDAPAMRCDADHTMPYPQGPTHPSNLKMYCRAHHLVKTFVAGWTDRQHPDGTIEITTPTGHTHHTIPHGAELFPTLAQPTGDPRPSEPKTPQDGHSERNMKMPRRSQTREQDRQDRINTERRLRAELNNDLKYEYHYQTWIAEHYGPPPPF